MSKLRERLTKMGGPYDYNNEEKDNQGYDNYMKEKRDNMQLSDSAAQRDFPDHKYKNGAGLVSPLNIILMDYANSIYNMEYKEAVQFVLDNIEALNSKYSGDPWYDTFSEANGGYFRKMKYILETQLRPKTTTNLIQYLQNAMMKGLNIKGSNSNSVTLADILSNKDLIMKTAAMFENILKK